MAGKFSSFDASASLGFTFDPRLWRAYAEGRAGRTNPYSSGSTLATYDQYLAFIAGVASASQGDTCYATNQNFTSFTSTTTDSKGIEYTDLATWATLTYINAGFDNASSDKINGALSFNSVLVPQGQVVSSATLGFTVAAVAGTPDTRLKANKATSAGTWKQSNLPTAGTLTTAYVAGPTTTGAKTLDITAVVNEVFATAGWASGNRLAFAFMWNGGTGADHNFTTSTGGTWTLTITA